MKLSHLLSQRKLTIFERWLDLIFSSYPPETTRFLKKEKDRFNNPVAYRLSQGARGLVDALVSGATVEEVSRYLDEIIRIKAVQDFSLESQIDGLALLGFDVYVKRREKLYDIRVNEVKAKVSGLLRKAGINVTHI